MTSSEVRKLSAIMFTDIVGYTAMMQQDEATAMARVAKHRQTLEELTAKYNGEVIEYYGDGSLSIYGSALQAVRCAVEMQQRYLEGENVPVRIGIHMGDIIFREDTVFGDGVNVASRIQDQGIPGSVLISSKINNELTNHSDIAKIFLGKYTLKNVSQPVDIFAISHPDILTPKKKARKKTPLLLPTLLGLALLLAIYFFRGQISALFSSTPGQEISDIKKERIAVPLFQNFTYQDSLDYISHMSAHWITKGLLQTTEANVVSYRAATAEPELALASVGGGGGNQFASKTGASNIIEGDFSFKEDSPDTLVFSAWITDLSSGEIKQRFEDQSCHRSNPLVAVSALAGSIAGWWESRGKTHSAPNFKAYRAFLKAWEFWDYPEQAERNLLKSIRLDPGFTDPYFDLFDLYKNDNRHEEAEVLLGKLDSLQENMSSSESQLLEVQTAKHQGKNKRTYQLYIDLYKASINNELIRNTTAMVRASDYTNSPRQVMTLFEALPAQKYDYKKCGYCKERLYIALRNQIKLGKLSEAEKTADLIPLPNDQKGLYRILIKYNAHVGDTQRINSLIQETSTINSLGNEHRYLNYLAARELTVIGNIALRDYYAQRVLQVYHHKPVRTVGRTHLLIGNYDSAAAIFDTLLLQNFNLHPSNLSSAMILDNLPDGRRKITDLARTLRLKAVALANLNRTDEAIEIAQIIETLPKKYVYGRHDYYVAAIYAQLGMPAEALKNLREAIDSGERFLTFTTFENDPDLKPLWDDPRYQEMIQILPN